MSENQEGKDLEPGRLLVSKQSSRSQAGLTTLPKGVRSLGEVPGGTMFLGGGAEPMSH